MRWVLYRNNRVHKEKTDDEFFQVLEDETFLVFEKDENGHMSHSGYSIELSQARTLYKDYLRDGFSLVDTEKMNGADRTAFNVKVEAYLTRQENDETMQYLKDVAATERGSEVMTDNYDNTSIPFDSIKDNHPGFGDAAENYNAGDKDDMY